MLTGAFTGALGALGALLLAATGDPKVLPAETRSFVSPSGRYELVVRGAPGWPTPQAHAQLFARFKGGRDILWSRALPQRFGPGSALVSDQGRVLMLDEGMNTPSDEAIWALDRRGGEVARYSMAAVIKASGARPSDIVSAASIGTWQSAAAGLKPGSETVEVEAGRVPMALDLKTGRLRRR